MAEALKKLWNVWEIRLLVLSSLSLQIILILFANIRKKINLPLVKGVLWLAYLMADLIATYSLGVLSRNQNSYTEEEKSDKTIYANLQLMAFWAPFLLLHLGGPDTITAFSLEDNQLWLRHGLGLIVQVGMATNILMRFYPGGHLLIPYVLVFLSGFLKYSERTWALKRGSMDGLRTSMLGKPDPGPDYDKPMDLYSSKLRAGRPAAINVSKESQAGRELHGHRQGRSSPATGEAVREYINDAKMMHTAYELFLKFKGLFVESIFSFEDRKESQSFFRNADHEWAFKVVEIELSFAYDVLYTKAPVSRTKWGIFIRVVCLMSTIIAALMFHASVSKHNFLPIHRDITYALFLGAVAIDIVSFARLLLSDWTVILIDPRCSGARRFILIRLLQLCRVKRSRWSNKINQYNLLGFCLRYRRWPSCFLKFLSFVGLEERLLNYCYTNHVDVPPDLKKFIFEDLNRRSRNAQERRDYRQFTAYRGEWVLEQEGFMNRLVWSITGMEFDESLLIWHIATDLCFSCLPKPTEDEDKMNRRIAQRLSNYLLYLLVVQPLMLSSTSIVGVKKYMDTCAEVNKFFRQEAIRLNRLEACRLLLSVNTDLRSKDVKGDRSKSVLWDGCSLAKSLEDLGEQRWRIICNVLLEMLCYAGIHCRGFYHANRLSEGGELLTFIWFLVTHLGMGEQYMIEIGDATADVVAQEMI